MPTRPTPRKYSPIRHCPDYRGAKKPNRIQHSPPTHVVAPQFTKCHVLYRKRKHPTTRSTQQHARVSEQAEPKNALLRQRTPFRSSSKARTTDERKNHEAGRRKQRTPDRSGTAQRHAPSRHTKRHNNDSRKSRAARGKRRSTADMIHRNGRKNNRRGIGVGAEGASLEGKYMGVLVYE